MAWTKCPHCGASYELPEAPLYPAAWQAAERRQFAAGAADLGGVGEYMRETPTRAPDLASDFAVPLAQALVSGVVVAVLSAIWLDPRGVLIAGVVGFGLAWLFLLRGSIARLSIKEHVIKAPEGEAPAHVTRLSFSVDGYQQQAELAIPADKLMTIARACSNGRAFSEREWSGSGRLLSGRAEYERIRDFFLAQNWLAWRDPGNRQQGLEWSASGKAALRALSSGKVRPEDVLD